MIALSKALGVKYRQNSAGIYEPDLNDSFDNEESSYDLPSTISMDFNALEESIAAKYAREWGKVQMFYNKLFPDASYGSYSWGSYNALPYTITDQEANDVGVGMSKNYLKSCIDTVVSRLKNLTYEVQIQSEAPLLLLEMYKKQVERYFRSQIRSNRLEHMTTECFHDAAILGYSHLFMDPWSRRVRKICDYELGYFESEFNKNELKRIMIKERDFPVSSLAPYIEGFDNATLKELIKDRDRVEVILYIDCFRRKKFVTIEQKTGPFTDYNYDNVLLTTYSWDMGIGRTYTTSLFDQLLPLQRQINKFCAKESMLFMNFKGKVPIIASAAADMDVKLQSITNQSGEILILPGPVSDVTKMVGELDVTPLPQEMDAVIEGLKSTMLELAGTQEISMNLDNLRSAAAVVALDQLRDSRFQSQMFAMAEFVEQSLVNIVRFNAGLEKDVGDIPWQQLMDLVEATYLEIEPVHNNDPEDKPAPVPEDYQLYAIDQFIIDVVNKRKTYDDISYVLNLDRLKGAAVNKLLRFKALGEGQDMDFEPLERLCVQLFIDDVKSGQVQL